MGKSRKAPVGKNAAAAAAADKSKPDKPSSGKNKGKTKPDRANDGPAMMPVPIKKVPSLRGTREPTLHAAGAFLRAPSPSKLPLPGKLLRPPSGAASEVRALVRMASREQPSSSASSSIVPIQRTASGLQREQKVVRELHGNMLYLTMADRYPELAGKLTGMLLEGLDASELADVIASEATREATIAEALQVLREAGDERAVYVAPLPAEPTRVGPPAPLTVDVALAQAAKEEVEDGKGRSGLTPAFATSMLRMSPRVSAGNPYQTAAILGAR